MRQTSRKPIIFESFRFGKVFRFWYSLSVIFVICIGNKIMYYLVSSYHT